MRTSVRPEGNIVLAFELNHDDIMKLLTGEKLVARSSEISYTKDNSKEGPTGETAKSMNTMQFAFYKTEAIRKGLTLLEMDRNDEGLWIKVEKRDGTIKSSLLKVEGLTLIDPMISHELSELAK